MIEALRNDELLYKLGGRFKLTALIQKRTVELMEGARPLVDTEGRTYMEVAIQEILEGKITIDYEQTDIDPNIGKS